MNIQPITYNDNITMMGKTPNKRNLKSVVSRIKQKILDASPSYTFADGEKTVKRWVDFDNKLSKPAENRCVMGATAILLQPTIDASNKKVDKETRQISICRTLAKIIAGTCVGMMVRGSVYKAVAKMTNMEGTSKYSKSLLPKDKSCINDLIKYPKKLTNYKSALSTGIAIAAMCVTNFLLDAPLTVFLTNKFSDYANLNKAKEVSNEKRA